LGFPPGLDTISLEDQFLKVYNGLIVGGKLSRKPGTRFGDMEEVPDAGLSRGMKHLLGIVGKKCPLGIVG
jgi:hypothetical protein